MISPLKSGSERSGPPVDFGVFLAFASGLSALWFSRSYFFNSDRVGWGDGSADRNQFLFWWGAVISVVISLVLVIVAAICSKRLRFAVAGAGTLSGILMFVSQRPDFRYMSWPLLPGIFASMMALGVHSDAGTWIRFLWMFGINTVFYAAIIAGVLALLNWRKRLDGKAKS